MAGACLSLPHCTHQFGVVGVILQCPAKRCHRIIHIARLDQRQATHPLAIGGIGELRLLLRQHIRALLVCVAVGKNSQVGV